MRRGARTWGLAAAAALALAGAAAIAVTSRDASRAVSPRPESERPPLLLVTSLPLVFAEEFTLKSGSSPALQALDNRYRVVPIGTTDSASLRQAKLLLMAHPLAQPAEDLVALDQWVRGGGRILLLADPRLDWPSERPLGDKLRPPPAFADTGLLLHWGLRLEAPEQSSVEQRSLGSRTIQTASPGALTGACQIAVDRLVAHCRIGKGQATVIADADFLNVERFGDEGSSNLQALLAELGRLEH